MAKFVIAIFFTFLYCSMECKVSVKAKTDFELKVDRLSSIVENLANNHIHPTCTMVTAWEKTPVLTSSDLLKNHNAKHVPVAVSQIKPSVEIDEGVNITIDPMTQYIPWPVNESNAESVGTCVLFVVIVEDDVNQVLLEMGKYFGILPQRHFFVLWYTGDDFEKFNQTLFSDKTRLFKYKLSAIPGVDGDINLLSVCFFCNKGEPSVVKMGTKNNTDLAWHLEKPYIDTTLKLNGKHVRSVFLHESNLNITKKLREEGEVVELGHTLMEMLSDVMDFRYHQYEIDIGEAAAVEMQLEDGTWIGFIGDLMSGKADFCPGSLVTSKAYKYISYTEPTILDYITFTTALPKPLFTWKTVFQPYDSSMWMLTGISILVSTAFLVAIMNVSWQKETVFEEGQHPKSLWLYTLPFLILTILGWGPERYPASHSSRAFIILWLLFALVLSCAYQCKLVGFMTFPAKEIIPETYYELEGSDYDYGGHYKEMLFAQMILADDHLPHIQRFIRKLLPFPDLPTCMKASLNRKLACISLRLYLYYKGLKDLNSDGSMLYKMAPDAKVNIVGAAMVPKNAVTLDTYSRCIQGIRENGMFDFLEIQTFEQAFRIGLKNENRWFYSGESETKPMAVDQLKGAFFCWGVGFAAAIASFIVEASTYTVKKAQCCRK